MIDTKHEHRIGSYTVRTEWKNNVLYYDIFKNGLLHSCGIDRLSLSEDMALAGIADRLFGKDKQRNAA